MLFFSVTNVVDNLLSITNWRPTCGSTPGKSRTAALTADRSSGICPRETITSAKHVWARLPLDGPSHRIIKNIMFCWEQNKWALMQTLLFKLINLFTEWGSTKSWDWIQIVFSLLLYKILYSCFKFFVPLPSKRKCDVKTAIVAKIIFSFTYSSSII